MFISTMYNIRKLVKIAEIIGHLTLISLTYKINIIINTTFYIYRFGQQS